MEGDTSQGRHCAAVMENNILMNAMRAQVEKVRDDPGQSVSDFLSCT